MTELGKVSVATTTGSAVMFSSSVGLRSRASTTCTMICARGRAGSVEGCDEAPHDAWTMAASALRWPCAGGHMRSRLVVAVGQLMHVLILLLDGLPARLGRDAHLGRCAQGEARCQPWRSPPVRRSRSRAATRRHGGCERGAAARARRRGARTGFGAHGDPTKREVEPAHAAALRSLRGLRAQRDAGYWGHGRWRAQAPRVRSFCAGSARAQGGRARLLAPRASAASGCAAARPRPGSCDEETQSAERLP